MPLFAKHNGVFVIMFGYNGSRNSGGQKSQAQEPQVTTPQNTEKDSPLKKTLVLFIKIAVAAVIVALLIKYNYQDFRNGISVKKCIYAHTECGPCGTVRLGLAVLSINGAGGG